MALLVADDGLQNRLHSYLICKSGDSSCAALLALNCENSYFILTTYIRFSKEKLRRRMVGGGLGGVACSSYSPHDRKNPGKQSTSFLRSSFDLPVIEWEKFKKTW